MFNEHNNIYSFSGSPTRIQFTSSVISSFARKNPARSWITVFLFKNNILSLFYLRNWRVLNTYFFNPSSRSNSYFLGPLYLQSPWLNLNNFPIQESLCVTDPVTSTRIGLGGEEDDNDHRMMASTTVFVLEPGASALGQICFLHLQIYLGRAL